MATQVPQPVDNGHRETGQEIHNIAATNGSICLAGTFQDVTIGNNHPGTIEEKIDSCRNALFVSHPDLDIEALVSAKGKRTEGTCRWILPDPHYQAWLAKEFPVLRVSGGPGKGKTMLALFLTEQLKTLCRQTGDRLLLFFCRFQDNRYNDPRNVLRSLIYQLLEFSHECPQITEILKYFESPEKAKDVMSNFEGLWKIFETLLSQPDFRTIWCIIDGIDECHSPETLAEKFYEHCRQRTVRTKVQLLMLGRDIGGSDAHHVIKLDVDQKKPTRGGAQNLEPLDLVSVLGRDTNSFYAPNLIELDMNHRQRVKSDVECFIISGLEPLEKVPRFAQIREEVTSMLVEKAEGTFLWVSFVIAELRGKKTCLQIRDTVESFPKGLNATFARMLCRIEPEYRQASASILKWVAFAERPLNLNELAAATAKAATGKYSEADLEATADIIQLLGPFLQVQRRIVFFVHQSAKEYLMKIHQDSDSPLGQSFNFAKCHGTIAHRCLETLKEKYPQNTQDSSDTDNFDEADHIYKTDKECPSRRCLTAYAKKHWSYHTRLSAISPDDINRPFFENMVLQRKAIISLHQASFLGVVRLLESLHRHTNGYWRSNVNLRGNIGPVKNDYRKWGYRYHCLKPLSLAIVGAGDESTIKFLLEHGADSQASMREAFIYAVEKGQSATIRLLLDRGVSCRWSIRGKLQGWWGSAVELLHIINYFVRCRDPSDLMRSFFKSIGNGLERCYVAQGKVKGWWWSSLEPSLYYPKHQPNPYVTNLHPLQGLRRYNSFHMCDATLLSVAVRYGRGKSIVQTILDHEANTVPISESGIHHALCTAAANFCLDVLKLLLDYGADINAKSANGVTPLIAALLGMEDFQPHKSSVSLRQNTRFHHLGPRPPDPEQEEMVRVLIESGADINLCGRIHLYEPLLRDDSDKWSIRQDLEDETGWVVLDAPPIVVAAHVGWDRAINVLVEHGADCNTRATEFYLPKSKHGHLIPSRIKSFQSGFKQYRRYHEYDSKGYRILSKELPRQVRTRQAGSALVYASTEGNQTCVEVLLGLGADISIEDGFGMTALMWARKKGFTEIEEVLKAHDEGRT